MVRTAFSLPLRQTEGLMASVLSLAHTLARSKAAEQARARRRATSGSVMCSERATLSSQPAAIPSGMRRRNQ